MVELSAFNKTKSLADWALDPICSCDVAELKRRLALGWKAERAITEPYERPKKHSRFRGVTWHRAKGRWVAQIRHETKLQVIGYFTDEKQAALAFNERAKMLLGSDAKLNRVLTS